MAEVPFTGSPGRAITSGDDTTPQRTRAAPADVSPGPSTPNEAYIRATLRTSWDERFRRPDPASIIEPVATGAFADVLKVPLGFYLQDDNVARATVSTQYASPASFGRGQFHFGGSPGHASMDPLDPRLFNGQGLDGEDLPAGSSRRVGIGSSDATATVSSGMEETLPFSLQHHSSQSARHLPSPRNGAEAMAGTTLARAAGGLNGLHIPVMPAADAPLADTGLSPRIRVRRNNNAAFGLDSLLFASEVSPLPPVAAAASSSSHGTVRSHASLPHTPITPNSFSSDDPLSSVSYLSRPRHPYNSNSAVEAISYDSYSPRAEATRSHVNDTIISQFGRGSRCRVSASDTVADVSPKDSFSLSSSSVAHSGDHVGREHTTPLPSPPLSPRTAAAIIWLDSGLALSGITDASRFPPEYYYTVTGMRKRKALGVGTTRPPLGHKVHLNGRDIAVFLFRGAVVAFDARCPHAGGNLELGDIEEFNGKTCVCCPRHGFLFEAAHDGCSLSPPGSYKIETYPTRIEEGMVVVGFPGLDKAVFESVEF